MSHVVLITGDRHATERKWHYAIDFALSSVAPWESRYLIHGAAAGIDAVGALVAIEQGFQIIPMPAQWREHGKSAGPRRNTAMLHVVQSLAACGYTAHVFAFHDTIEQSKGTKDMAKQATRAGLPVKVYASDGTPKWYSEDDCA